jgi:hypothetical protein
MQLFIQYTFSFQILLISLISLQSVMAVLRASSLFLIPQFPDPGNCHGHDMDTLVTDAFTLATNAVNVINILLEDYVPRTPQNMIFIKVASVLWGVKVESASSSRITFTSPGKSQLQQAASKL